MPLGKALHLNTCWIAVLHGSLNTRAFIIAVSKSKSQQGLDAHLVSFTVIGGAEQPQATIGQLRKALQLVHITERANQNNGITDGRLKDMRVIAI